MEKSDITIIGAGVVGLAIAHELSRSKKDITVLEKCRSFGQATSSRNSEVIHAGLYYPKASLKAKTCIRGKNLLYELCNKNKIPYRRIGKLIVARGSEEINRIEKIEENASECGVKNLVFLKENDIRELEPDIVADLALFSPDSGIVDTHGLMSYFFNSAKAGGIDFAFSVEATNIKKNESSYNISVKEPDGDIFSFQSSVVINSTGLESDRVSELVGIDPDKNSYRIHYSKGQYFRIRNPDKFKVSHLVYPPPGTGDLGIHITPDLAGGLRLGPDARYVSNINYDLDESRKTNFFESVSRYLPSLELNDLIPDTAGIRPKLQDRNDCFRDFVIQEESKNGFPNFINLIGIESPGLTSSMGIAEIVKNILDRL